MFLDAILTLDQALVKTELLQGLSNQFYQWFGGQTLEVNRSSSERSMALYPVAGSGARSRNRYEARLCQVRGADCLCLGLAHDQYPELSSHVYAQVMTLLAYTDRRAEVGPEKVGRNAPCPCGSGLTYKKCHGQNRVFRDI